MPMELKITSPKQGAPLPPIEFNFKELEAALVQELKKYQDLVYTDETIKEAKEDRAKLNKFSKALNAKRIEIKKLCLRPYEDFEQKIRLLDGLVQKPLVAIAEQVSGYEERKKNEKREAIEKFWDEHESSVKVLVTLDAIFNPRWLNTTFAMSKVEEEIQGFFTMAEEDIAAIKDLGTEFEEQVMRVYLREFKIAPALAENTRLLEQKARREEYERQQQEKKAEQAQSSPQPAAAKVAQVEPERVAQAPTEEVCEVDFRVWATRGQLEALKAFLNENGIKYGRVEDKAA